MTSFAEWNEVHNVAATSDLNDNSLSWPVDSKKIYPCLLPHYLPLSLTLSLCGSFMLSLPFFPSLPLQLCIFSSPDFVLLAFSLHLLASLLSPPDSPPCLSFFCSTSMYLSWAEIVCHTWERTSNMGIQNLSMKKLEFTYLSNSTYWIALAKLFFNNKNVN